MAAEAGINPIQCQMETLNEASPDVACTQKYREKFKSALLLILELVMVSTGLCQYNVKLLQCM